MPNTGCFPDNFSKQIASPKHPFSAIMNGFSSIFLLARGRDSSHPHLAHHSDQYLFARKALACAIAARNVGVVHQRSMGKFFDSHACLPGLENTEI